MVKRKKKYDDINTLAAEIVSTATKEPTTKGKNPAAVALGRLGGLKGGRVRARLLSARRRKEIASKAAKARWARRA